MAMDTISDWKKSHYTNEITPKLDNKEVTLMGWVRELRLHGNLAFIILADREGDCQVTVLKDNKFLEAVQNLNREDVIAVKGTAKKSDKTNRGVEILLNDLKVLNTSITPLPLEITEKTPAEFDTRLNNRVLDLRKPKVVAIFKIRDQVLASAREYFRQNKFMEIETPKIIATATEGGAELFPVKYFEENAYLRQSPQLYKELMTSCFEKVFEIGPVFRAEPSDTPRHLAEVTQMDIEMGFATEEDTWKILEGVVEHIYTQVKKNCAQELELLGVDLKIPKAPFERVSYTEAVKKIGVKFGEDIPPEGEKKLTEIYKKPIIVYEYPLEQKPYYIHPHDKDPKLSYGFDLIMDSIEMASGGRRIHDHEMYEKRLREKGLDPKSFEEITKFFRLGMPPHAGWAIGVDRLVMVICGLDNIREAVLFPRDVKRLKP
ncbi:MAG: aspartate--tRNA(Asn) ligase [archaeon]